MPHFADRGRHQVSSSAPQHRRAGWWCGGKGIGAFSLLVVTRCCRRPQPIAHLTVRRVTEVWGAALHPHLAFATSPSSRRHLEDMQISPVLIFDRVEDAIRFLETSG
jgi:hypothetical protein